MNEYIVTAVFHTPEGDDIFTGPAVFARTEMEAINTAKLGWDDPTPERIHKRKPDAYEARAV